MKKTTIIISKMNIAILLAVLIGAGLYVSLIFNNNLWMDEAFSAALLRGSMSDVLARSASDTLPPLYNVLNKIMVTVLGYHPWAMKLTSVIPMILCMLLGATTVRRLFGDVVSLLYITCLWGMPGLLYYGVEIRMYALGLFFVTACGIFAYDYFCSRSRASFILMTLSAVLCGYTHHFALVSAGFVYLILLAAFIIGKRSCLTGWIASVIICAALYLPCMLTTLEQMKRVSGYFTMPDISVHTVIQCFKQPFITQNSILSAVLLALFSLTLVLGILRKNISGLLFISVYPLTLFFGCLATVLLKSNIFTDRYLVPSLGLLWLGFAIIMADIFTLAPAPLYGAVAAVILLCTLKTYSVRLVDEYKSGVEDMIAYFNENISEDDAYIIYEDNYQIEICFRYYFPDFAKTKWNKAQSVTGSLYYLEVPGFEDDMKKITENGYSSLYLGDFSFDRYSFKLYRLTPEE